PLTCSAKTHPSKSRKSSTSPFKSMSATRWAGDRQKLKPPGRKAQGAHQEWPPLGPKSSRRSSGGGTLCPKSSRRSYGVGPRCAEKLNHGELIGKPAAVG